MAKSGQAKTPAFAFISFYLELHRAIVLVGAVGILELIWSISETMNGFMAIPNLIGILGLYKIVCNLTKEYFCSK